MRALAELTVETIAIDQRHEELEIFFLAGTGQIDDDVSAAGEWAENGRGGEIGDGIAEVGGRFDQI